ncbi:MAG: metallophosphoesterase [Herpetosiphonaceae bacterium]|nr:metallophosphoesterase [Herpetosiphonaceae bacterium]
MRILRVDSLPFHSIAYHCAAPGGGTMVAELPLLIGWVDTLPAPLTALICTSDLQGISLPQGDALPVRLLGEMVAEELLVMTELGMLPAPEQMGVLLAGDFYAAPQADQRGVSGDVRGVWHAMRRCGRWVTGVAGNHDQFAGSIENHPRVAMNDVHLLDGRISVLDGLRIGGLGGIIGNPRKPMRRTEHDYMHTLATLLRSAPDVVVMHESPAIPEIGRIGSLPVRKTLDLVGGMTIICGHCHWEQPLAILTNETQILNVDGRVVILCVDTQVSLASRL